MGFSVKVWGSNAVLGFVCVCIFLPIPASVSGIFVCPNNGMAACFFFNVRTDVDTCDCTLGLYCKHGKAKSKTVTWVRESACSER